MERAHRFLGMILARSIGVSVAILTAAHAAPSIEAFGHLPAADFATISPSGEHIAVLASIEGKRRVLVMTPDGKVLNFVDIGELKIRGLEWAGNDHLLVITSATVDLTLDVGRAFELSAVIQLSLDGQKPWAVFANTPGIQHAVFGYYGAAQVDGHWCGYFGGITNVRGADNSYRFGHSYPDLYRVDLQSGKATLEAHGSEREHDWVLSENGQVIAHSEFDDIQGKWRLYSGTWIGTPILDKPSRTDDIDLLGAGREPGTALVLDTGGDVDVLSEVKISDGKIETLLDDKSITNAVHDPVTHLLLGAYTLDEPGMVLFDPKLQARVSATHKAFPGLQAHIVSFSTNFQRMIVETDGGDDSGTYWFVDISTGKADSFGFQYPTIKSRDVGPTRLIDYEASDGLKIEGVLTLPPGRKPENLPLVMFPHGGPIGIRDAVGFDWWAQALASRGYAVFQPNYRGSSGYGADFLRKGFGEYGRKMLSDISDGMSALAGQHLIDPKRACIVGASYGGYAALAGVTLQQGLYRCAVSVAGPADMTSMVAWHDQGGGGHDATARYFNRLTGVDGAGRGVLNAISPVSHAQSADAPILLIHGKDDTRVPIKQSEDMAAALKRAKKPYEFVVLPKEDHFLSREETRIAMLKATVAFVEKYNPP
jgi:dienelactone hydrolase